MKVYGVLASSVRNSRFLCLEDWPEDSPGRILSGVKYFLVKNFCAIPKNTTFVLCCEFIVYYLTWFNCFRGAAFVLKQSKFFSLELLVHFVLLVVVSRMCM